MKSKRIHESHEYPRELCKSMTPMKSMKTMDIHDKHENHGDHGHRGNHEDPWKSKIPMKIYGDHWKPMRSHGIQWNS